MARAHLLLRFLRLVAAGLFFFRLLLKPFFFRELGCLLCSSRVEDDGIRSGNLVIEALLSRPEGHGVSGKYVRRGLLREVVDELVLEVDRLAREWHPLDKGVVDRRILDCPRFAEVVMVLLFERLEHRLELGARFG